MKKKKEERKIQPKNIRTFIRKKEREKKGEKPKGVVDRTASENYEQFRLCQLQLNLRDKLQTQNVSQTVEKL
jgi:hypothetical protein